MSTPRDPHLDLLDDARLEEARRERARERSLRQRSVETASLAGSLRDLAERGTTVTVVTRMGRRLRGTVAGVATDHLVLVTPTGRVHLRTDVVTSIRPEHGSRSGPAQGERDDVEDLLLTEVLARLVADRPDVVLGFDGPADPVRGRLDAVGADVVSVRVDGGGELVLVPAVAVVEVTIER